MSIQKQDFILILPNTITILNKIAQTKNQFKNSMTKTPTTFSSNAKSNNN